MLPALASLIVVQDLDTAVETARQRLAEMPLVEQQLDQQVAAASTALEQVKERLAANHTAHRELEKQVAVVDGRLARFDEHKAAVKTNQEFTALLHEIATAKEGKDGLENQILELLEEADAIAAAIKATEGLVAAVKSETGAARKAMAAERTVLEAQATRLAAERTGKTTGLDPALLARYEQLLKQRRMLAIAPLNGEICGGCNVRLRPAVTQQVRRSVEIIHCDSCQRILYVAPTVEADTEAPAHAADS